MTPIRMAQRTATMTVCLTQIRPSPVRVVALLPIQIPIQTVRQIARTVCEDPLKVEEGLCGCGVDEIDTDEDGTPNCIDECVEDPDKVDPGQCGCGTDTDSDNDGVADCEDLCVNDPAKTEPGEGCGISDTDINDDGIADCNDECLDDPNKSEPGVCGCGFQTWIRW